MAALVALRTMAATLIMTTTALSVDFLAVLALFVALGSVFASVAFSTAPNPAPRAPWPSAHGTYSLVSAGLVIALSASLCLRKRAKLAFGVYAPRVVSSAARHCPPACLRWCSDHVFRLWSAL